MTKYYPHKSPDSSGQPHKPDDPDKPVDPKPFDPDPSSDDPTADLPDEPLL